MVWYYRRSAQDLKTFRCMVRVIRSQWRSPVADRWQSASHHREKEPGRTCYDSLANWQVIHRAIIWS